MNATEAAKAVAFLATSYPGATFPEESAAAYEGFLADLDYPDVVQAMTKLVQVDRFLPSVAEIRFEVFRVRKLARDLAAAPRPLQLTTEDGRRIGPSPREWGTLLASMLEDSARHKRMVERWRQLNGGMARPDPAQPFIDLAQAGARGDDVRERFKRTVVGDVDESERRYP